MLNNDVGNRPGDGAKRVPPMRTFIVSVRGRMLNPVVRRVVKFLRAGDAESGASAVEYALLVALIGVVVIGAVTTLGTNLKNVFTDVANTIGGMPGGSGS